MRSVHDLVAGPGRTSLKVRPLMVTVTVNAFSWFLSQKYPPVRPCQQSLLDNSAILLVNGIPRTVTDTVAVKVKVHLFQQHLLNETFK